jgi:hypothetical protein
METQEEELKPELLIQYGEAISRFLNDTTVQKVFSDIEATYYKQWKAAASPEDREALWAKVSALGDFKFVLERTVQSGLHERAVKAERERAEHQI